MPARFRASRTLGPTAFLLTRTHCVSHHAAHDVIITEFVLCSHGHGFRNSRVGHSRAAVVAGHFPVGREDGPPSSHARHAGRRAPTPRIRALAEPRIGGASLGGLEHQRFRRRSHLWEARHPMAGTESAEGGVDCCADLRCRLGRGASGRALRRRPRESTRNRRGSGCCYRDMGPHRLVRLGGRRRRPPCARPRMW